MEINNAQEEEEKALTNIEERESVSNSSMSHAGDLADFGSPE
jgi:hypothetical protein